MITIHIKGGLGNQLFQYAAGRAMTLKAKCNLALDVKCQQCKPKRDYYLDKYNITKIYKAKGIALEGYWQSEKYFKEYESIIRKELTLKDTSGISELKSKLQKGNAVAIHVRRGDYLKNPKYGTCSTTYYGNAIDLISTYVNNPTFYVFSDDPDWCEDTFPCEVIRGNTPIEDMYLMSCCNHFILANSTFSWWGAWLSNNKDKMVIVPSVYFGGTGTTHKDFWPESWIKIKGILC